MSTTQDLQDSRLAKLDDALRALSATDSEAARLARLIVEHQPCVALTGAGVSTESGIPDFRSPKGMWARFDPLEYATLGAFQRDPEKVWRFYAPRFSLLTDAEPNRAHLTLAKLESLGLLRAVITQNIDLLHERAGSREVVEVLDEAERQHQVVVLGLQLEEVGFEDLAFDSRRHEIRS